MPSNLGIIRWKLIFEEKTSGRASAGRSSIRHWRKDLTNDEKKCNSFRQFDESIKSTYFK